jgi:thiamine pyrophosphate-dependent acetolactate synthase large subunit-like protein
MYESDATPVTPPRAALHLSGAAPDDGVVVADAGMAGFWLARTFPTGHAGSVIVPALDQPGFAVAAAITCGLAGRPCVSVIDGPPDESTLLMLEVAATLGVPVAVQSWVDGDTSPEEHVEICRRGFGATSGQLDVVGVDAGCFEPLAEALGAITAWGSKGPES